MVNRLFVLVCFSCIVVSIHGQSTLVDRSGTASFFSEAPLENIDATNSQVIGAINLENGEVAVTMMMKDFSFKKSLMQEHFNENYVESDKYPKATYTGYLSSFDSKELEIIGSQEWEVKGDLTIHGVTRPLSSKVLLHVSKDEIAAKTTFQIELAAFDITIPKVVFYNIAEQVEITATFSFDR